MVTILGLPKGMPVLVGALSMHRRGQTKGRPVLSVAAWCPWCLDHHRRGWPDPPFGMDCVLSLDAPCRSGPFAGSEVMVGLDPARHGDDVRLIHHFNQALRRWKSERRYRPGFDPAGLVEVDRRGVSEQAAVPLQVVDDPLRGLR